MRGSLWEGLKQRVKLWREVLLPGTLIIGIVVLIRLSGILQVQELMALDSLSTLCPAAGFEQRVTIVGVTEADLSLVGGFPIPDRDLANALQILSRYQPGVIGLDIFRNSPVDPGHDLLVQALRDIPNIIGAEVALSANERMNVSPPPGLPPTRIGFADVLVDLDGKLRRSILASRTWAGDLKYSLAVRMAQLYLGAKGIGFSHGDRVASPIQFGAVRLPRLDANAGGYIQADTNGNQTLINFCKSQQPLPMLSLQALFQQQFAPELIRDRVVLLGMTASSIKDVFFTSALRETLMHQELELQPTTNQLIYGVEFHAHATNQLLSAVLDHQALISVWPDFWEYLWIVTWGIVGILLGVAFQSPWRSLLGLGLAGASLWGMCYGLLLLGWWVPLVSTCLALTAAGLVTSFFDSGLRFELEQRRQAIERTYEAIHNGPLQQLAAILRHLRDSEPEQLEQQLRSLNDELRSIFEYIRQEATDQDDRFYLGNQVVLDLQAPLPELLYQVYDHTLAEPMPVFAEIRHVIPPNFRSLEGQTFSLAEKRGLCLFLQEALHNVGKHAIGATQLQISCLLEQGWYLVRVVDNGSGGVLSAPLQEGQGTRQARSIARELKGTFQRRPNYPQGTICQLTWPRKKLWLKRLLRLLQQR